MRIISDSCVTIFVTTPLRVEHSCKDNCAQAHCPSRGSASSETFFSIAPSSNRSYRICEAPLGATTNPRRFRLAPLMRQDVGEICSQFLSKRHLPFTSLLLKVVGWLVLDPYGRTKPLLPIGLFAKKLAIHVWISCQLVHWIVAHQYRSELITIRVRSLSVSPRQVLGVEGSAGLIGIFSRRRKLSRGTAEIISTPKKRELFVSLRT